MEELLKAIALLEEAQKLVDEHYGMMFSSFASLKIKEAKLHLRAEVSEWQFAIEATLPKNFPTLPRQ